jgi:hypothetical protein
MYHMLAASAYNQLGFLLSRETKLVTCWNKVGTLVALQMGICLLVHVDCTTSPIMTVVGYKRQSS